MKTVKIKMIVATFILSLPLAFYAQPEKNRYNYMNSCEIVDDWTAVTGYGSSICIDSQNGIHIAYYDATNGDLKYARRPEKIEIIDKNIIPAKISNNWIAFTVDQPGNVGSYASIAVDSYSRPSISYYDAGNKALKVARYFEQKWQIAYVDSGNVGMYSSLAIDRSDRPCISYYDAGNKALKFARFVGNTWNIETVDKERGGDVGQYTSLKIGKDDIPRIAYYDNGNGKLKFAKAGPYSWDIEDVDGGESKCGLYASLALGVNDTPHIAYYDNVQADLKYAVKQGFSWEKTVVDGEGSVGQFASLALDNMNNPRIAYYDFGNKKLKYAEWQGLKWFAGYPILNSGDHGMDCALAIDKFGIWYVSYRSAKEGKICYSDNKTTSQILLIPGLN